MTITAQLQLERAERGRVNRALNASGANAVRFALPLPDPVTGLCAEPCPLAEERIRAVVLKGLDILRRKQFSLAGDFNPETVSTPVIADRVETPLISRYFNHSVVIIRPALTLRARYIVPFDQVPIERILMTNRAEEHTVLHSWGFKVPCPAVADQ